AATRPGATREDWRASGRASGRNVELRAPRSRLLPDHGRNGDLRASRSRLLPDRGRNVDLGAPRARLLPDRVALRAARPAARVDLPNAGETRAAGTARAWVVSGTRLALEATNESATRGGPPEPGGP